MKLNPIVLNRTLLFGVILLCFSYFNSFGQTIGKPDFNGTRRCTVFNNEVSNNVTAEISGFDSSVTFELVLSNKVGKYGSGELVLIIEPGTIEVTGSTVTFDNFFLPELDGTGDQIGSDIYNVRIRSSNGIESSSSNEFEAYYYNGEEQRIIPGGFLCGVNQTLVAQGLYDTYLWYKIDNSGNVTKLEGETGNTLDVNSVGKYYYYPGNLGTCIDNFEEAQSNIVTVTNMDPVDVFVTISGSTSMCASEIRTLAIDIPNPDPDAEYGYQWVKDGAIIAGANEMNYTLTGLDAQGIYNVNIFDSSLAVDERCTFSSVNSIEVDLLNPSIKFPPTQELKVFLIPGSEQILEVETEGENQVITWIKDGSDISNSNTNTFVVRDPGIYTARLTATSPCANNGPFTTINSVSVENPSSISSSISYDNPAYQDCDLDQIILEIEEIRLITDGAESILAEESYQFLDFEWFKNSEGTGEIDDTILIDGPEENGNYFLRITYNGANYDSDNILPVVLNAGSFDIQQSDGDFVFGSTIELFIDLPEDAIVSDYAFQWFLNGTAIPDANNSSIEVSNGGSYSVRVQYDDCDEALADEITISSGSAVIPNVITPNGDGFNDNWVLTGEFTNKENVEINIYTTNGELDFSGNNYNGDWPQNSNSNSVGTIYYYVINRDNSLVEKGSITIIR